LLVGEIAKTEQLNVSDEEVEKANRKVAELSREEISRVRSHYAAPEQKESLRFQLLEDKVLEVLEKSAAIEDGGPLAEDKRQLL